MNDLVIREVGEFLDLDYRQVDMLVNLYNESHRHYHNSKHIKNLYDLANEEGSLNFEMAATILFHDAVYYPQSLHNEELSAALYRSFYRSSARHSIYDAILASKRHTNPNNSYLPKWALDFLDYDLAGLASDEYNENTKLIFKENNPTIFLTGRVKFINSMLDSTRIYWNHPQWEDKARDNLKSELNTIKTIPYAYLDQLKMA